MGSACENRPGSRPRWERACPAINGSDNTCFAGCAGLSRGKPAPTPRWRFSTQPRPLRGRSQAGASGYKGLASCVDRIGGSGLAPRSMVQTIPILLAVPASRGASPLLPQGWRFSTQPRPLRGRSQAGASGYKGVDRTGGSGLAPRSMVQTTPVLLAVPASRGASPLLPRGSRFSTQPRPLRGRSQAGASGYKGVDRTGGSGLAPRSMVQSTTILLAVPASRGASPLLPPGGDLAHSHDGEAVARKPNQRSPCSLIRSHWLATSSTLAHVIRARSVG